MLPTTSSNAKYVASFFWIFKGLTEIVLFYALATICKNSGS
jgi:hypothetical protein